MKKIMTCLLIVFCVALVGGCSDSNNRNQPLASAERTAEVPAESPAAGSLQALDVTAANLPSSGTQADIGEEAAGAAALNHAGLAEDEVSVVKNKRMHDDGRTIYRVEFYKGNTEYEYDIDAYTGEILAVDYDVEDSVVPGGPVAGDAEQTGYITAEAAWVAALNHAGVREDSVTFRKARLDRDDKRTVYDIEFYSANTEYDYEVDAYTGEIVSCDYDIENYMIMQSDQTNGVPGSGSQDYITPDEAKAAALDRAGQTDARPTYTEVSFYYEDGLAVYQIEFICGGQEYEVEINAIDGTVVEYNVENRDN